jgi:hypothetical protein
MTLEGRDTIERLGGFAERDRRGEFSSTRTADDLVIMSRLLFILEAFTMLERFVQQAGQGGQLPDSKEEF